MLAAALGCAVLLGGVAVAAPEQAPAAPRYVVLHEDVSIPFALRTVNSYRVGEDGSLILRRNNRWFRAELAAICARDLPWRNSVGIRPGATGSFDRLSTVIVDGHRCQISSLDEIADPRPARTKEASE
jgi:hypothetical protein